MFLKCNFQRGTASLNLGKAGLRLPLTSVSASVTSSVAWVRSFGFFQVFGAVTAVWAAMETCICYSPECHGADGAGGDELPSQGLL